MRERAAEVLTACTNIFNGGKSDSSIALQGLQSSNPDLAGFCSNALLSCEAFLHPRTTTQLLLPLPEAPVPAVDILRSSILKTPVNGGTLGPAVATIGVHHKAELTLSALLYAVLDCPKLFQGLKECHKN